MKKLFTFAIACAILACASNISIRADVINDFTTDSGALDGNLTSITDGDGTFSDLLFATTTPTSSEYLWWASGTEPADATAATNDQRIDTGQLGNEALTFSVAPSSALDKVFIFFNAGTGTSYQAPLSVSAVDSGGGVLGVFAINSNDGSSAHGDANTGENDLITATDSVAVYTASRTNGGDLANRQIGAVTVDIAEFGVSDLSQIAGFQFDGEFAAFSNVSSLDINAVGIAVVAIPEPASCSLIACFGLGLAAFRRRKA